MHDEVLKKTQRTPELARIVKALVEFEEFGRGDDTVGNPHRAQIYQFELFELILLLKLDEQFPVEQFEAAVSLSAVPSPPSQEYPAPLRQMLIDGLPHATAAVIRGNHLSKSTNPTHVCLFQKWRSHVANLHDP